MPRRASESSRVAPNHNLQPARRERRIGLLSVLLVDRSSVDDGLGNGLDQGLLRFCLRVGSGALVFTLGKRRSAVVDPEPNDGSFRGV
jgi:hypothetical protein